MNYKLYDFGERLAKLRHKKNLSQNQLSLMSGIAVNSVCLYENKGVLPSVISLCAMAEVLDVTVGELLGEEAKHG